MASIAGKLLIVDDDPAQMRALCATLESEGYLTAGFTSAKQALSHLATESFDVLLTDLTMPEIDGIELLQTARREQPQLVGVVMTGHGSIDTAVAAMKAGALDYILKPFTLRAMRPVLQRALIVRRLLGENQQLRRSGEIVQEVNIELERTIEDRTRQLTEANRELEAFSQSVSHDLRAPLRVIDGFSKLLLNESGDRLDEQGRSYLRRILDASERMEELIGDLMRLSHAAGAELRGLRVDLSQIAATVVRELQMREPARRVSVEVESDMQCWGDPQLLHIALENLIGNAWKFTRKVENAHIEIGRRRDRADTFFVRDNGAGFESQAVSQLFAPFRRLHASTEFEGSGVGLSIVQRIIRRHGGTITAQGAVGEGATFSFMLPARERATATSRSQQQ